MSNSTAFQGCGSNKWAGNPDVALGGGEDGAKLSRTIAGTE